MKNNLFKYIFRHIDIFRFKKTFDKISSENLDILLEYIVNAFYTQKSSFFPNIISTWHKIFEEDELTELDKKNICSINGISNIQYISTIINEACNEISKENKNNIANNNKQKRATKEDKDISKPKNDSIVRKYIDRQNFLFDLFLKIAKKFYLCINNNSDYNKRFIDKIIKMKKIKTSSKIYIHDYLRKYSLFTYKDINKKFMDSLRDKGFELTDSVPNFYLDIVSKSAYNYDHSDNFIFTLIENHVLNFTNPENAFIDLAPTRVFMRKPELVNNEVNKIHLRNNCTWNNWINMLQLYVNNFRNISNPQIFFYNLQRKLLMSIDNEVFKPMGIIPDIISIIAQYSWTISPFLYSGTNNNMVIINNLNLCIQRCQKIIDYDSTQYNKPKSPMIKRIEKIKKHANRLLDMVEKPDKYNFLNALTNNPDYVNKINHKFFAFFPPYDKIRSEYEYENYRKTSISMFRHKDLVWNDN